VGEQGIPLENGVDLPLVWRHIVDAFAVKKHPAGRGGQKPANNSQSGGFAAAGGAKQREEFMIVKIEIDTVKYPLPVELHDKVLESDEFFGHYPPPFLSYKMGVSK